MKKAPVQEAELKNKAGTAWSHSYLNQKPWHPLSYPNQKRKWIAENMHLQRQRKTEEISREFAQEQEFFRQTAMLSKKEQEKAEVMKGLSFMYLRPPGYNAESARAAEIADEIKKLGPADDAPEPAQEYTRPQPEMKKPRVLDIYGRPVPTEEEFPALKNAPRLDTGTIARAKPFGVEIRNVKCARCGSFGHQSGDRECTMKDTIMPSEQARLRRDDPLNAMTAQIENNKWELKQQLGGMSPPRGGFKPDDPNQQIIAEDDIYDEYGGFLGEGLVDALASFSRDRLENNKKSHKEREKRKKKKKRRIDDASSDSDIEYRKRHRKDGRHEKDAREGERSGMTDDDDDEENSRGSNSHRKKHRSYSHHKSSSRRHGDSSSDSESKSDRRHGKSSGRNRDSEHRRHREKKESDKDGGGGGYDSRGDHVDAQSMKSRRTGDKHDDGRGSRKDDTADTNPKHSRHYRR